MNDLVYNEIVATPGYELEFAVGTTYSLDAEAFLALALSFARMGEVTDADFQHLMRLLEGIRQANNHIALFCNRGGLKPPTRSNPLYPMLDRSVFEVADERKGHELANFHPKIWVIKERSLDQKDVCQVKLIVMSRNLTKDTSLDVAVTMTAKLGVGTTAKCRKKHEPLKRMLLKLAEFVPNKNKKKAAVKRLANELDQLGPFTMDAPFEDYEFIPNFFGESLNDGISLPKPEAMQGEKMIVVSPFIDVNRLRWLNERTKKGEKILITRLDSLTPQILDLYKVETEDSGEVWVSSPVMAQNDIQPMDLHAKMYFVVNPPKGSGSHLWLGSANATDSGFARNAEFLLHLSCQRKNLLFGKFKDLFCNSDKQLFQRIEELPEEERKAEDRKLEREVRQWFISHNNLSAEVCEIKEGWEIVIHAKKCSFAVKTLSFAPLQEPDNTAELEIGNRLCRICIANRAHLSEFYILMAETDCESVKMVIKITTTGIPENRDNIIFQSLIQTPEDFLHYVEMMITDKPYEIAALLNAQDEVGGQVSHPYESHTSAALYEAMLKIAASEPERLRDIEDVLCRLKESAIPKSFEQMYNQFKLIIKKRK